MLEHNIWVTGFDYTEETLFSLALQGWYDIDYANVFDLLPTTDKWQNTCRAHVLHPHHCQNVLVLFPVSPQVHYLREIDFHRVGRSIKLTTLRDTSVDFGTPKFVQLYSAHIEVDWGQSVCGLVLGYNQKILLDCIFITL